MKVLIYNLFVIALLFSSCGEDAFTSVVELDIPEHQSTLATSFLLSADEEIDSIFIAKSINIVGDTNEIIENAEVRLFKNGNLFEEFEFIDSSNHYFPKNNIPILADGSEYRFEVSALNFATISATQNMPMIATVEDIDYRFDAAIDSYGDITDELVFNLIDDPNEENYYAFEIYRIIEENDLVFEDRIYFDVNSLVYEDAAFDYYVLSDASFNGNTFNARLLIYNWFEAQEGDTFKLVVKSLSYDNYLFQKSLDTYYNSSGNPFAEPSSVYENIENGHGIFRTESQVVFEFQL